MSNGASILEKNPQTRMFALNNAGKINTYTFVKIYVLTLLKNNGPMYAAQMATQMKEKMKWAPSDPVLLKVLKDLNIGGFVTWWWNDSVTRDKKLYRLEDIGVQLLYSLTNDYRKDFRIAKDMIDTAIREVYGGSL